MPNIKKYSSIDEIQQKLNDVWGNNKYTVVEPYPDNLSLHTKIKIKCNACGNISEKEINTIYKFGCKFCSNSGNRHFWTNDALKKHIIDITDGEYELISDAHKSRDIGVFKHNSETCKNPNKMFNMKIHGFLTLMHRCPFCNSTSIGTSDTKGNLIIKKYLDDHNILYEREYAFNDCRSSINKLLYFDFYLPEKKIVIEFDGEQHSRPIEYFGGEEAFKVLQEHDNIKNKYCENNNIKMIRIQSKKYVSYKKIIKILEEQLN